MKIVFYRALLTQCRELTPTERVIYSFLISKSLLSLGDFFDSDGSCMDMSSLYESIEDDNWLELCSITNSKIAQELCISRQTVIRCVCRLKRLGYISHDKLFVGVVLLRSGYFELHNIDVLNGELLIFYSYIKDKSKKYGGCVDTYKSVLAEQLNTTKVSITKLLNRLYELGFAKRLEDGTLMIK